jgi:hypothetical protein
VTYVVQSWLPNELQRVTYRRNPARERRPEHQVVFSMPCEVRRAGYQPVVRRNRVEGKPRRYQAAGGPSCGPAVEPGSGAIMKRFATPPNRGRDPPESAHR